MRIFRQFRNKDRLRCFEACGLARQRQGNGRKPARQLAPDHLRLPSQVKWERV